MERTYHAIVLREPVGERGIVESRIARDPRDRKKMAALPVHDSRWGPFCSILLPPHALLPTLPPPPPTTKPAWGEIRALQAVIMSCLRIW